MSIWNVYLGRRRLPIKVRRVLTQKPEFMVIIDTRGDQHELSADKFSSDEWKKIKTGSTLTLIIGESVMACIVQPPKVSKTIRQLILEAQKQASGLFFIWACEHCGTADYVEYEDGDDNRTIAEHVFSAHRHHKEAKPDCAQDVIRIFDHRGMEQRDSELLLSARRVAQ